MDYAAGEALILTQVRAVSGFTTGNAARAMVNGWKQLDSGSARNYVVLRPGPFERSRVSTGGLGGTSATIENRYVTFIEVWCRVGTDYPGALAQVIADEKAIAARLDQYRKAGDTTGDIFDVFMRSGEEPLENDGKHWVWRISRIEWAEHEQITAQE